MLMMNRINWNIVNKYKWKKAIHSKSIRISPGNESIFSVKRQKKFSLLKLKR